MYEGLNSEARDWVEILTSGDFLTYDSDKACLLFKCLAKETYEWEMITQGIHDFNKESNLLEEYGFNRLSFHAPTFDAHHQYSQEMSDKRLFDSILVAF